MRAVIGEMKQIEPLQPDPPGFQDGDLLITADGTWYTLEGPGRYQDSHMGKFRVEANVGTPLARWARRVEEALAPRSEEYTSELQSLMRHSYAVYCLKKQKPSNETRTHTDDST